MLFIMVTANFVTLQKNKGKEKVILNLLLLPKNQTACFLAVKISSKMYFPPLVNVY